MGAHYFIRDGEVLYENAASQDKDYVMIEGAVHGGEPCTPCETFPGQYSNTVKNRLDYMEQWIRARSAFHVGCPDELMAALGQPRHAQTSPWVTSVQSPSYVQRWS